MGLNLSFESDAAYLAVAHCADRRSPDGESDTWYKLDYKTRKAICSACPLGVNENFHDCYPRMGSYGYVASLADMVRCLPVVELKDNPFIIATSPGGYRIECEPDNREEFYHTHLQAISACRQQLQITRIPAAVGYRGGERVDDFSHAAHSALNSMGYYHWGTACGGVAWGVHLGQGIARITGERFLLDKGNVTYFDRVTKREGITRDGKTVAFADDCLLLRDSCDDTSVEELRYETIPALHQFAHLLDTAETALTLALKHGLTVLEC